MLFNSFEFKIEGYTLEVDHCKPEDFGKYQHGEWVYTITMDATEEKLLSGTSRTINNLCYNVHSHLLRCKYKPDAFMLFLGIEEVRNTLSLNLDSDIFKVTMAKFESEKLKENLQKLL